MAYQQQRQGRSVASSGLMSNQTDIGWDAVQRELKEIDHGQAALESSEFERGNRFATISRGHWKQQETSSHCANPSCKKKFGALDRKLHCRRCGEVFCDACTQFKRKLSLIAKPDPDGQLYRVCQKCFDLGPQPFGTRRDWTAVFVGARQHVRQNGSQKGVKHSSLTRRLDVKEELDRLQRGFETNAASWLKSTVTELRVSVPDWQRSLHWQNPKTTTCCHVCRSAFGILATKHHCKVCGRIMCKQCSAEDLLLFMEDGAKVARWALYGFEGCPAKEPSARLYLRCCHMCREDLKPFKAKQLDAVDAAVHEDVMGDLAKIHSELCQLQEKLEKQLPIFQEHVESLNIDRCSPRSGPAGVSPIKQLAKSQMDVSDCITRFALLLNQKLRRVRPTNKLHATVLSRIAQSKMLYYRERLFMFRALKRCLVDTTPPEVLDIVQHTVELQTITGVYILMRQLSMEVLNITEVFTLDADLLEHLMPLQRNETCTKDMELAVDRCCKIGQAEDWEDHLCSARKLISMRYKEKEQRLVKSHHWPDSLSKPSRQALVLDRCYEVVSRVHGELEAKSSARHFEQSKEALTILRAQLETNVSRR